MYRLRAACDARFRAGWCYSVALWTVRGSKGLPIPSIWRMKHVAALFVMCDGPYAGQLGVDVWDESRDARLYAGPWPVVAHPPCERWGRYWNGGPSVRVRRVKGDDGGCFAAALAAVRRWGGVLEHPAASAAWVTFGLRPPMRGCGWTAADFEGGFTCCVDQEHYGHRAQKATWLYAVGVPLPSLNWEKGTSKIRMDDGFHSTEERRRSVRTEVCQRLSKRQRTETPVAFRDLLLTIARGEARTESTEESVMSLESANQLET